MKKRVYGGVNRSSSIRISDLVKSHWSCATVDQLTHNSSSDSDRTDEVHNDTDYNFLFNYYNRVIALKDVVLILLPITVPI